MTKLREYALDLGTDVSCWLEDERREVVVELFEQDEARAVPGRYPDWICDALAEVGVTERLRLEIIRILKVDEEQSRRLQLGELFEAALIDYPRDSLTARCEENIHDWRAAERGEAA